MRKVEELFLLFFTTLTLANGAVRQKWPHIH